MQKSNLTKSYYNIASTTVIYSLTNGTCRYQALYSFKILRFASRLLVDIIGLTACCESRTAIPDVDIFARCS